MKKVDLLFWRFRLMWLLMFHGYAAWGDFAVAWEWTGEECWTAFYLDEMTPSEAVREDQTYWSD